MDIQTMGKILISLKSVLRFSPRDIDLELVAIWCSTLTEFDEKTIKNAFRTILYNKSDWPTPAEVRRLCIGKDVDLNPETES
jgi:hypothetical protein